jgi:ribonuclease H
MFKIIGVDEAGKGPVFGSMFLGFSIYNSKNKNLEEFDNLIEHLKITDSKLLKYEKRENILNEISNFENINLKKVEITPIEIDICPNMLDLEILKICNFLNEEKPNLIIIDALTANTEKFTQRIKNELKFDCELICENKADLNYKIVGLASIFAKQNREYQIKSLKEKFGENIGSGYTSDKKTQIFLKENLDNKEFLKCVRKSWKTYKNLTQKNLSNF